METLAAPTLATLVLFTLSTAIGMIPVVKAIRVREARHELRVGSASRIRGIAGWAIIAFWLMGTWFFATIIGDWAVTGDLDGAVERSWLRLQILLEIAAALGESD
ncbi:hypothetical protein KDD17_06410 [Sulfitobacter albidus]|uniref:Uncharacterized protein n=1 Tax=Sulfitobacter albidus TaxID=2829501 RepID=A0A975JFJ6_9RHOB|nr:hypothetical protein [Sulfitobacter albidus]QUJ77594.1 hypothetical protein KDD17_06410 [Sulfitobacter albidus]